jgi:hypothetical protein
MKEREMQQRVSPQKTRPHDLQSFALHSGRFRSPLVADVCFQFRAKMGEVQNG